MFDLRRDAPAQGREERTAPDRKATRTTEAREPRWERPFESRRWSERDRRTLLAFAEATIPGAGRVERADEHTLAKLEEMLEHVWPHLPVVLAKLARGLDEAARARTGRPFRDLSAARQEQILMAWEQDRVLRAPLQALQFAIKFAHFDREPVYTKMGGSLNVVKHLERPRWLEQVVRAHEWEQGDVECEVVVVGTGAGGAVVGRELAERGFAVVFVEEGELHRRDDFTGSSIDAHRRFYRGGVAFGNNLFPVFMGRLVGGSTAINGGTCFRTPSAVLDRWCEELGTDEFSREKMAAHFERVESILQVAPAPRRFAGPIADVIARGCDALGWSHFAIVRNAPGCEGSGFCDFGCRTDARRSTNISYVPPALERGAMLFTGLAADRVIVERGRAVGIEGVARKNGRRIRVRGRAVVFAGGALPTPLFLLKNGICNSSGQVGRNLTLHPSGGMNALFDEPIRGYAHIPQGYGCDEHLRDGILLTAAQPDLNYAPLMFSFGGRRLVEVLNTIEHVASFGILIADSKTGRISLEMGGSAAVLYRVTQEDADRYHRGLVAMGEICWAAGAKKLWPAIFGMHTIERGDWERFRRTRLRPTDLMLTSYHPLGTCRMGPDPRTSVVGLDHEAHDLPGFFIVDGSTVPGPLGVNPQLTIMALATRAAGKIADKLG